MCAPTKAGAARRTATLRVRVARKRPPALPRPGNGSAVPRSRPSAVETPKNAPVVFIEARSIYNATGPVPEQPYLVPFGKARIARRGADITLVANSYLVPEAIRAAESLSDSGVSAEVIDMRTISPWDERTILESVSKTGRLVVLDTASQSFGVSAEIATTIYQKAFGLLKSPIERVTLPDTPTPCASNLEQLFYPTAETVCQAAQRALAA